MDYKASKDKVCKSITTLTLIIMFGFAATIFLMHQESVTELHRIATASVLVAVVIVCYILTPKSYSLEDNELRIHRPAKNRIIKTEEIAEVRSLDDSESTGMIRTFGNGGLFGYYGKFYNRALGHVTLYATKRTNFIFIKTKSGKKIIISPDDMGLLSALQSKIKK